MSQDNSLTPEEVADLLKIKKNTVYELVKRGDLRAYRIGRKLRIDIEDVEAYKKQGKGLPAELPFRMDLPTPKHLSYARHSDDLIICGQDILLDVMTRYLGRSPYYYRALRQQVDSFDGLQALYHGEADVATAHLWDGINKEYNSTYIKYLIPGIPKLLVNLVSRIQGFYVAKGNKLKINNWEDLTRKGVRFINREKGSGDRVLLDQILSEHGIDHRHVQGYDQVKLSHLEVASLIARGEADVGLGIQKAALQIRGVDFIPLHKERYDMVLLKENLVDQRIQAVLDIVQSRAFRADIEAMGDYDVSDMGQITEVV
ncbi:MAG: substrate-binding domain-containing protein [Methylocystaceae bacterium]